MFCGGRLAGARTQPASRVVLVWMNPSGAQEGLTDLRLQWVARPNDSELADLRPALAR